MNALLVMEIELECVKRASSQNCDRDCANCDLVLPDEIVTNAYNTVIAMLKRNEDDLK